MKYEFIYEGLLPLYRDNYTVLISIEIGILIFFSVVHGGRSRLHLIDLASCERYNSTKKETSCCSMSLNGLGNVIIALINGAKHVPHK